MKTFKTTFLAFLALLLFTSNSFAAQTKTQTKNKKPTELLFVLVAGKGAINKSPKSKHYVLTLKDVTPEVIYFTDRPDRYTNKISLQKFLDLWKTGSFKKSPPNAAMQAVRLYLDHKPSDKRSVNYVVELTNPQYDAKTKQVKFNITPLKGNANTLPTSAKSDYVALFIDNVNATHGMCPGCINH